MKLNYKLHYPVTDEFIGQAARLRREIHPQVNDDFLDPIEQEITRIRDWFSANVEVIDPSESGRNSAGVIAYEDLARGNTLTIGQAYAYRTTYTPLETVQGNAAEVRKGLWRQRNVPLFRPAIALGGISVRPEACGRGIAYELASRALRPFDHDVQLIDPDNIAPLLLSGALDSRDNTAERPLEPLALDYTVGHFRAQLKQLIAAGEPNS